VVDIVNSRDHFCVQIWICNFRK